MIATQAAPHLEPGEQVQTGFIALTGPGIFTTPSTVIVTDRSILVVHRGQARRGPRDVVFGEPKGVHHTIHLDRAYKVNRQYYDELVVADEALQRMRSHDDPA